MSEPIIEARDVAKKFIIRRNRLPYYTFRDAVAEIAKKPLDFVRRREAAEVDEVFWALRDVSFTVDRGETLGIIGKNGAGKSTLLKILSRITPPTKGLIHLRGRVASLLEVGTGFNPELTGRENIFLNGAILGMTRKEIRNKFDEIVDFSGVEKFIDTPVKRYSSGMYVRLAFAVAAHLEPEILIVDEVLAVGDAEFQKKCLGKMQDVATKEGRTVIFVSHNMAAVRSLCSRGIIMERGKIALHADINKAVDAYAKKFSRNENRKEWDDFDKAPGSKMLSLASIRLTDTDGRQIHQITTDTSFNVELKYLVKPPGGHLNITMVLYDANGNCVFGTINNHEKKWYGKQMPAGMYLSTCRIPGSFLNSGHFSISLTFFNKNYTKPTSLGDLLQFEVHDGHRVRGDYLGAYGGVVRPLLNWQTENVSN